MTGDIMFSFAARSHTGLVRKNNQDSGYAGPNFLLIADGMGGHAGGDVASAIAVARLAGLDEPTFGQDALEHLRVAMLEANERISNSVVDKPELAGMGTTVTALLRSGDRLALAHIGDSRGYLLRDGDLTQVTADHTFVQMLVDEGRITPEEAETHPQRSVVMRVLGDVGSAPQLDLSTRETRVGDRWMLCSDGLTGFAPLENIKNALATITDPGDCCDALVDMALEGGGADNVTVVIGDVVPADHDGENEVGESVGSVRINPHYALFGDRDRPTELIDTGSQDSVGDEPPTESLDLPHTRGEQSASVAGAATAGTLGDDAPVPTSDSHQEQSSRRSRRSRNTSASAQTGSSDAAAIAAPAATQQVDLDDEDDEPRRPRRGLMALLVTLGVIVVLGLVSLLGWNFVRNQYYVANNDGYVTVYQGVSQKIGPIALSAQTDQTDIAVTSLNSYSQRRLDETIPANSKESADEIVKSLRDESQQNSQQSAIQPGATDATTTPDPAPSSPPTTASNQGYAPGVPDGGQ